MAVIVDGEKKEEMPTNPVGKDGKYYDVQVKCTSSKTSGLWDYNAWRLNLDYIESNSKCNLTFTSSMSKAEYDKYIQAGVALRRNTYRGKNITKYYTGEEKVNDKDLYKQISDGTFDDIYVGDYFTGKSGKIWLVADLDNYLGTGNSGGATKHHATIIPDGSLMNAPMNQKKEDKDTTEGGYLNSEMVKTTLEIILKDTIEPDFTIDGKVHVLEYPNLLSSAMNTTFSNMYGQTTGASSGWSWVTRKLDLMSEVNVYGTTIWSSSGFDIGIDSRQYAIFQLRPELFNKTMSGESFVYWLKAVTDSKAFAYVGGGGGASRSDASNLYGVRPRFLID